MCSTLQCRARQWRRTGRFWADLWEDGEACYSANPAKLFMACWLLSKWKQPFGYFLSHSIIKPAILHRVLMAAIEQLKSLDLTINGVICDQGLNNCSLFRNLGVAADKPYFHHLESEILVMFDPPHLLKNIRNNLLKHSFFNADSVVSFDVYSIINGLS